MRERALVYTLINTLEVVDGMDGGLGREENLDMSRNVQIGWDDSPRMWRFSESLQDGRLSTLRSP